MISGVLRKKHHNIQISTISISSPKLRGRDRFARQKQFESVGNAILEDMCSDRACLDNSVYSIGLGAGQFCLSSDGRNHESLR